MNNNKRIGRRAIIGSGALLLITGMTIYLVETLKHEAAMLTIAKDILGSYTSEVMLIALFIIGGISVTDAILKRK